MNNKNVNIEHNLIVKSLTNAASEKEEKLINDWLNENSENKKYYEEQKFLLEKIGKNKDFLSMDVNDEWNKLDKEISENKNTNLPVFFKAAAGLILVAVAAFIINFFMNGEVQHKTLISENNFQKITFPDGSHIELNRKSELVYPEKFSEKERKVQLTKGEAFFKVKHAEDKAFKVEAGDVIVKVVGTEFYVKKSIKGNVEVSVKKGKVQVYNKGLADNITLLKPGEKAVFDISENKIEKSDNNDKNYNAWQTKILVFENEKLQNIISNINEVYGSEIVIGSEGIKDCRITTKFDNQSLNAIFTILESAINIKIKQKGKKFEINGEGC